MDNATPPKSNIVKSDSPAEQRRITTLALAGFVPGPAYAGLVVLLGGMTDLHQVISVWTWIFYGIYLAPAIGMTLSIIALLKIKRA